MVSPNEKTLKTAAYAVISLCCITVFGHASQKCGQSCGRYSSATIAFGVIGFLISTTMLVLWFIAEDLASKICLPLSNFLFVWLAVGVALVFQTNVKYLGYSIFYLALVFALLVSVYDWNNADFSVKLVSEVKANPSVDAPPLQEEQA